MKQSSTSSAAVAFTPAQQYALIADVAEADLEQPVHRPPDQRRDLLRVVGMAVQREIDPPLEGLLRQPLHAAQHVVLEKMLRETDQPLGGEPDVPDVGDVQQRVDERLELGDVQIGDVAARHDHVAHRSGCGGGSRGSARAGPSAAR